MAPKKQPPAPPTGPRPKRVTRAAAAKITSPDPKSSQNGNSKTTSQSLAVLQTSSSSLNLSSPPPTMIAAETAANTRINELERKGGVDEKLKRCSIEKREKDKTTVVKGGNETLAEAAGNKLAQEITEKEEEKPKKKKMVKKMVVKVVKKIVKKRVPKSMLKDLAFASTCSSSLNSSKELNVANEVSNDGDGDGDGDDDEEKGLEEEREAEIVDSDCNGKVDDCLIKEAENIHNLKTIGDIVERNEEEEEGGVFQKSDFVSTEKLELVGDKCIERVVQNYDSVAAEMDVEKENVLLDGNRNEENVIQMSDSIATAGAADMEVVGERNNEGEALNYESVTEMPTEAVNMVLGVDRNNEDEVPNSDSATEMPTEVNLVLDGERTNKGEVLKSYSAAEMSTEVVNMDVVEDVNHEAVAAQVVESSSGYEEVGKENGDMGNGRIALSGELEALERRRRRRTEIFIGGLSTGAKEEDVRKVFEEVGEIVELRLVTNSKTGKNKGFAFVRYASATDAKKALEKYAKVEICGKQCSTAPVEGNDTIFLGNIDKKWTHEDVIKLLQENRIEKIDKVTVMANPSNVGRNRGFAFVEFETHKDAEIAFKKLQKKDLGKLQNVKVAWAEPLSEPDEEELMKVKSVYAEYLSPSWDEEKLRSYFTKFGEIENIVLSRNLHSSKRKDFAFINFKTREAALACIESFNHDTLTYEGSQVNVKVSLAKPIPKGKPHNKASKPTRKEIPKRKHANQYPVKPTEPKNKEIPAVHIKSQRTDDLRSPGTSDLEQLLAERALRKQMQARLSAGLVMLDHSQVLPGHKRPFSSLGGDLSYSDPRGQTHIHVESSFPAGSLSHDEVLRGAGAVPHSYYHRQGAVYGPGHRYTDYTNSFKSEADPYRGIGRGYYRY